MPVPFPASSSEDRATVKIVSTDMPCDRFVLSWRRLNRIVGMKANASKNRIRSQEYIADCKILQEIKCHFRFCTASTSVHSSCRIVVLSCRIAHSLGMDSSLHRKGLGLDSAATSLTPSPSGGFENPLGLGT